MRSLYKKTTIVFQLLIFTLLASAQQTDFKEYRPLLVKNAAGMGITAADANDAVITHAYTDPVTQITFIYIQQAYQQVKVYNAIISTSFRDGSLLYASGNFVKEIATKAGVSTPARSHLDAVKAAARHLLLDEPVSISTITDLFNAEKKYIISPSGISKRNIDVILYWTPSENKQQVSLTWNVNIDELKSPDWWNVRINALTGNFMEKDNWTVSEKTSDILPHQINSIPSENSATSETELKKNTLFETHASLQQNNFQQPPPDVTSATYRVIPYPVESPIHGAFNNVVSPWLLAGAGNDATTLGWHFDNTTNHIITRGNNVFAYLDRRANNIADATRNWPDTSSTLAPTLNFIHNINTSQQPFQNTENKKVAIDNLFYWNNLIHDITYQYGFTEAAGNFQAFNLGRGGAGNDFVNAHALDSAGYNNANFSTPTDGTNGRMQMYTWASAPAFTVNAPGSISGPYPSRENSFTAPNKLINVGPVTGQVVLYNDDATGTVHTACSAAAFNAAELVGKIALIDATACTFISKVKKAQTAGAIGVMLYYPTLLGLGGSDPTVTIPTISITTSLANSMINAINTDNPVNVTMASGIYLDGDLDNGIVVHEYGHGISNRLTGGPLGSSCLGNAEQAGEGWSDYFGLMLTTNWATAALTNGNLPRPVGNYAGAQTVSGTGIRRYPYSTDMVVNPLTYANMATNTEVHATGEIWCATIWDMTWNIIQQQGAITADLYNSAGNGGNVIAMNLVMNGLKMQACNPGFLDSRDAILAADSILYGYAHKCAIWNAFARRGMGFSARQGSASIATDQVIAYDLPSTLQIAKQFPQSLTANAQNTITHTITCDCQPVNGVVIRDTIPAGFTYVSSNPSGTLNGNVLSFPASNFNASESKNFSLVLQSPAAGCIVDTSINDNREASTSGGFVSTGTPGWSATTTKSHTPASSWFAPNNSTVTTSSLTSANTAALPINTLSLLSFWHNYKTETTYDGGVVEYSTDGTTWIDAAPLFLRNGYKTSMDASTTLTGRKAFSGNSGGFIPSLINLSSLGSAPVSIRFRFITDNGIGVDGWYVDDILRVNGCGSLLRAGVYSNAGVRLDSVVTPMFVTPGALPLSLLWFYATKLGDKVSLDWKTVSEINLDNYIIEWSVDGSNWTNTGTQAAMNRNTNSYNFIHSNPANGINYYRLKMNDKDGRFTYSPVRIINLKDKVKPMFVLVPNPVNNDVTIYLSAEYKTKTVKIFDAAGSLVHQSNVSAGIQQLKISTQKLADGLYTVEAQGEGKHIERMMVQH